MQCFFRNQITDCLWGNDWPPPPTGLKVNQYFTNFLQPVLNHHYYTHYWLIRVSTASSNKLPVVNAILWGQRFIRVVPISINKLPTSTTNYPRRPWMLNWVVGGSPTPMSSIVIAIAIIIVLSINIIILLLPPPPPPTWWRKYSDNKVGLAHYLRCTCR